MKDNLPFYHEDELNTLRVLEAQSNALADAYRNYSQALTILMNAHTNYYADTSIKSRYYAYLAALNNLEAIKAVIYELKDDFHKSNLSEWIP